MDELEVTSTSGQVAAARPTNASCASVLDFPEDFPAAAARIWGNASSAATSSRGCRPRRWRTLGIDTGGER